MTETAADAVSGMIAEGIAKASVLSEAVPHIARYAGTTVVVKYGGHAMGDADALAAFARDVVLLKQIGIHPVVVHGGGPQIGRMLERLGIGSDFVDGLRVTSADTVEIVEMVLAGRINKAVAAAIGAAGGRAVGLSGKDAGLITAKRLKHTRRDPESNIEKALDLGFVGEPSAVDTAVIDALAQAGFIPVVAPIGLGADGETYNVNADTAAGAIAAACKARRFLLLTDVAGVLDEDGRLIPEMGRDRARRMIASGAIEGGMIPKVETCLDAVEGGVEAAVILDGRMDHAVLLEILTRSGAGTLIRRR
ncbi:MAG: acetylglutamate kinase [Alphaproteobacteria bacterium]|nr:acetylglutamate kinase [Alphaproteobacteria bacterium]